MGKRCVIVALCSEEPPVLAYSTIVQFLPGQASRRATRKHALLFSQKTKTLKSPGKSGPQVCSVLCEQTTLPTRKDSKLEDLTTVIKATTQATAGDPKAQVGGWRWS